MVFGSRATRGKDRFWNSDVGSSGLLVSHFFPSREIQRLLNQFTTFDEYASRFSR